MRTGILITGMLSLIWCCSVRAQGLLGFFHQQSTKKKLMLAQIAALAVSGHQQALGNLIEDRGLTTAHDEKNGEWNAHDTYYNSLSQVSPVVGAANKKKELMALHAAIGAAFNAEIRWQRQHGMMQKAELNYLRKVADGMVQQSDQALAEMELVTTPGKLKLTDAERLDRLDRLQRSMKDQCAFSLSFTGKCRKLALSRIAQQKDNEQLRKLYGN